MNEERKGKIIWKCTFRLFCGIKLVDFQSWRRHSINNRVRSGIQSEKNVNDRNDDDSEHQRRPEEQVEHDRILIWIHFGDRHVRHLKEKSAEKFFVSIRSKFFFFTLLEVCRARRTRIFSLVPIVKDRISGFSFPIWRNRKFFVSTRPNEKTNRFADLIDRFSDSTDDLFVFANFTIDFDVFHLRLEEKFFVFLVSPFDSLLLPTSLSNEEIFFSKFDWNSFKSSSLVWKKNFFVFHRRKFGETLRSEFVLSQRRDCRDFPSVFVGFCWCRKLRSGKTKLFFSIRFLFRAKNEPKPTGNQISINDWRLEREKSKWNWANSTGCSNRKSLDRLRCSESEENFRRLVFVRRSSKFTSLGDKPNRTNKLFVNVETWYGSSLFSAKLKYFGWFRTLKSPLSPRSFDLFKTVRWFFFSFKKTYRRLSTEGKPSAMNSCLKNEPSNLLKNY